MREQGSYRKNPGGKSGFAIVYPNFYRVGMSNLGLHIIYQILNERPDTFCERFFLPEKGASLGSVESDRALSKFNIIGFVLSYEMDYINALEIMAQGKIIPRAAKRTKFDPLIIGGGPCATFNPEPLADFFDAFVIGEGEVIMPPLMDAYYAAKSGGVSREKLLATLAKVPGVYVPSLYEHRYDAAGRVSDIIPLGDAPPKVRRCWVKNLDDYPAHTVVVTDDAHFDMYLVETARGCGRHCRFCMAGYAFRPPRSRSLASLQSQISAAKPFGKRLGLMGAAISDHPEIDKICEYILTQDLKMSVASFRADSVTDKLVQALARSGQKTLTLAPEAGSSRMRAVINKGIEEEHLFRTVTLGLKVGIRHFRLYFMVGLPYETEEDASAIAELTERLWDFVSEIHGAKLTLSINPFVPKPFTPFQWLPMAERRTVNHVLKLIRRKLKPLKQVEIIAEPLKEAYIQAVLARGDRRLGKVLTLAHRQGGNAAFFDAMRSCDLDENFYLYRQRQTREIFPWDGLDLGVSRQYLLEELGCAQAFGRTLPCFKGCRRCGVCD